MATLTAHICNMDWDIVRDGDDSHVIHLANEIAAAIENDGGVWITQGTSARFLPRTTALSVGVSGRDFRLLGGRNRVINTL